MKEAHSQIMNSYLGLIPVSARVRRKQSKMIIICIILAVFLVTTIFSLADAWISSQTELSVDKAGYWHICLEGIQENDAQNIAMRPDVAVTSWYDVINLDEKLIMDKDYYIAGAQTALCGIDEAFIGDIMHYFSEDAHVLDKNQIILTENARELLGVKTGDTVTLNTPAGDYDFVISGFRLSGNGRYVNSNGGVTSALLVKENQVGAFMNINTFHKICDENNETGRPELYIQFKKNTNLKKALADIREQFGLSEDDVHLNTILMAANGVADKKYISNVYSLAAVLFFMILTAGVMMIAGSMNSNVAQRLQFFGMLRCIGASKKQIIRFVRLEALNWCRTAVPAGTVLGIITTWTLSAGVKYLVGDEFSEMSVFRVSVVGIVSGVAVGVVTVFLAAQAPAKRASRVSPIMAVSGAAGDTGNVRHAANAGMGKVETVLGIHHAVSAKKNLLLMTGSFAFSIILFFCFSVLIEFVECLVPQKAYAPDIDITSADLTNSIEESLVDAIGGIEGVAHAFGRRMCYGFPAWIPDNTYEGTDAGNGLKPENIDLMSYDQYQLELLVKDDDLRKGSDITKVYGDSNGVLVIWDRDMPLKTGDKIRIGSEELEIAGMLKYSPFSNDGSSGGVITIIASGETFVRLTGITDYMIIDVQMTDRSMEGSNAAVEQIMKLSGGHGFRDRRDESTASVFYAFKTFVYGFIAVIASIALLNIVNSISMSVSARINQYGAMRAIGMSVGQLTKMIAVEAFTYGVCGCAAGCAAGLLLSKSMYDFLITSHFYYFTWSVPVNQIVIVLLFVSASSLAAVYMPAKRIRNMSVVDTIHTQ